MTVRRRSQKQEKSVARDLNANLVVASGSMWHLKGDVRSDKLLVECKTTEKTYYSVTSKTWEKIEEEALRDKDRIPLLIVDLEDRDRLVVFNPNYFEKDIPTPYENTYNGDNKKSFRLSMNTLEECDGEYLYGRIFLICGKRRSMLCCMRQKDFEETFRREL